MNGYANAIFSGFPTVELAHIVHDVVLPKTNLVGLYHVASEAISKFELLKLVAKVYKKEIDISREDNFKINRSLNAEKFHLASGYIPPTWPELVEKMYKFK